MELQLAKGVRDFPPEEKIIRQDIVSRLTKIFELYGYSPLETPAVERYDLLTAKSGAGEGSDAAKEIFRLKDQGGRELGLRFELTLSLARFIGMNPSLKLPFKRYEIGRVYRDGPIKLGRYREFWQCDVDVVGIDSVAADAEVLSIARDAFVGLGFDVRIEVNSRKLLNGILDFLKIREEIRADVIISLDKLKKVGSDSVVKELEEKNIDKSLIGCLLSIVDAKGTNEEKLCAVKEKIGDCDGVKELEELFSFLGLLGVDFEFNPSLARGLGYYTGPVYEVFLKDSEIKGSVAAGGRWDKMIGSFLQSAKEYPATGISFGLEPITDAIRLKQKTAKKTVTTAYVIPIRTAKESLKIAMELRNAGISADIDLIGRGPAKSLAYADSLGIPYAIFVGEEELKQKKVKLRDMKTGEEKLLTLKQAVSLLEKVQP